MEEFISLNGVVGFGAIMTLASVAFFILSIILFFKIWRMTNDIRIMTNSIDSLAKNLNIITKQTCNEEYIKTCDYSLESKGITYNIEGCMVSFSDGINGEIKEVTGSQSGDKYGVLTDDNYILVYTNVDAACTALHEYITSKRELEKDLYTKIEHTHKQ